MAIVNKRNIFDNSVFNDPTRGQRQNFRQARQKGFTPIKRYNALNRKLGTLAETDPNRQRLIDKINKKANRFGFDPYAPKAAAPAPAAPAAAPVDYRAQANGLMSSLFPKTSVLDPTKYVNQEMYNWELGQGRNNLDKYYASRGLYNSSAELEGNRSFQDKLAANTKADALSMAQADAERRQSSANRLAAMLNQEADRKMTGQQNQFDNLYNTAQLMLNQSPLNAGYNAANSANSTNSDMAQLLAQILGSGGGGGGGGGKPAFQEPFPDKPNFTAADVSNLFSNQSGNSQWTNTIADIAGSVDWGSIFG